MIKNILKIIILLTALGMLIITFLDRPWIYYKLPNNTIYLHTHGQVTTITKKRKPSFLSSIGRVLRTAYDVKELHTNNQEKTNALVVQFQDESLLRIGKTNIHVSQIIIPLAQHGHAFIELKTKGHLFTCDIRPWELWLLKKEHQHYLQSMSPSKDK